MEYLDYTDYWILADKIMLIIKCAFLVFVAVGLTAIAIVWFLDRVNRHIVKKKHEDSTAIAADMLFANYVKLEREYHLAMDEAERRIKRKEKKIETLLKWDRKQKRRIQSLEEQLKGFETSPVTMEKTA